MTQKEMFTIPQVKAKTRQSEAAVRTAIRSGALVAWRAGGQKILVAPQALADWRKAGYPTQPLVPYAPRPHPPKGTCPPNCVTHPDGPPAPVAPEVQHG